jgi:hypothetical protein
MSRPRHDETGLIPPPGLVRVELARSVREARRLRSLLRLAMQADDDRRFIRSLTLPNQAAIPGREAGR